MASPPLTVNSNQSTTFWEKIAAKSVQVLVDSRFSSDEKKLIFSAAQNWNDSTRSFLKKDFFEVQVGTVPSDVTVRNAFNCNLNDSSLVYVVKESSSGDWQSAGFNDGVPAATVRCSHGGALNQVVAIDENGSFDSSQYLSMVMHELGHVAGLNHSCASETDPAGVHFVNCDGLSDWHPYHLAVMYPHLEAKDQLMPNDIQRFQFLYQ